MEFIVLFSAIALLFGVLGGYWMAFKSLNPRLRGLQEGLHGNQHLLEQQKVRYEEDIGGLNQQLRKTHQEKEMHHRNFIALKVQTDQYRKTNELLNKKFETISQNILNSNTAHFLNLVEERYDKHRQKKEEEHFQQKKQVSSLIQPVSERLEQLHEVTTKLEAARKEAYSSLQQRCEAMSAQFSQTFANPVQTGTWGEIQLRKVMELSGMTKHVDFVTQTSFLGGSEQTLRPDAIVHLPHGKCIIIDAKTPMLKSYIEMMESSKRSEDKQREHLDKLKKHIKSIAKKSYHENIRYAGQETVTPEFVVMFIPLEGLYAMALEHDVTLFDEAATHNVIITTPSSFFALIKTVAFIWKEHDVTHNAKEVGEIALDIMRYLQEFSKELNGLGRGLRKSVKQYNKTLALFNENLLPQTEQLEQLGVGSASSKLHLIKSVPQIALDEISA